MRTFLLSCAGAAAALFAATSAPAYTISYGSSLASACYRYSMSKFGGAEAIQTCDRAIAEEDLSRPDHLATVVNRGIIRMNSGDFGRAEEDFNRAIALDGDYAEAYLNKAFLRLRQAQPSAAIELLDQSLDKRTREPALAVFARAVANEQQGRLRAAYADFRKAQELAPRWSLPKKELARYTVRGQ